MENFAEVFEKFENQENLWCNEGSTGVKNLCRLVHAMGYQDSFRFGQFAHNASYGDLIQFLEDNPGCIEAIKEWITASGIEEWKQSLEAYLPVGSLSTDEEGEEGECDETL